MKNTADKICYKWIILADKIYYTWNRLGDKIFIINILYV